MQKKLSYKDSLFATKDEHKDCTSLIDKMFVTLGFNFRKIYRVSKDYYRGSTPEFPKEYRILKRLGIKTIIDLRMNIPSTAQQIKRKAVEFGISYENIPLNPFIPPSQNQIDNFLAVLSDPTRTPVYVFCLHGQDRTGLMTALYRTTILRWPYDKAEKEMKRFGYHSFLFAWPQYFLKQYLKT